MACYFKDHRRVQKRLVLLQNLRKEAENSEDALAKTFRKALFQIIVSINDLKTIRNNLKN